MRYVEDIHIGHRFYDREGQEPLFPFGHGLSYSTFSVGELNASYDGAAQTLTATITVTNSGARAGWETVQLYARVPGSGYTEIRRLVGFAKARLEPGQREQLTITVPGMALSIWDSATSAWTVPAGRYTLWAGRSSRALDVQRTVNIG